MLKSSIFASIVGAFFCNALHGYTIINASNQEMEIFIQELEYPLLRESESSKVECKIDEKATKPLALIKNFSLKPQQYINIELKPADLLKLTSFSTSEIVNENGDKSHSTTKIEIVYCPTTLEELDNINNWCLKYYNTNKPQEEIDYKNACDEECFDLLSPEELVDYMEKHPNLLEIHSFNKKINIPYF